jgi:hypothetical protein
VELKVGKSNNSKARVRDVPLGTLPYVGVSKMKLHYKLLYPSPVRNAKYNIGMYSEMHKILIKMGAEYKHDRNLLCHDYYFEVTSNEARALRTKIDSLINPNVLYSFETIK